MLENMYLGIMIDLEDQVGDEIDTPFAKVKSSSWRGALDTAGVGCCVSF